MLAGTQLKTTNYTLKLYWHTLGHARDFNYSGKIGVWLSKNERVINKAEGSQAIKFLQEQFPELVLIDLMDFAARLARWSA